MKESPSKARLLVALQFLFLALLLLNPFGEIFQVERSLILLLYLAAGLVLIAAAIALGSALTASPIPRSGAELVTKGIYRWVRHPMYSALILFGIALLLGNANFFSALIFIALVLLLFFKSEYEDALLAKRHESAQKYQQMTGRFLPKF